jgi:hypothetical protein
MRRKLMWVIAVSGIVMCVAGYVQNVVATEPSGFTARTIAFGRFGDIDAANHLLREFGDSTPQKDKGPSDLYVQSNEWLVGGTTGWHSHPGHSLIIVTEGALTAYEGDDPSCTPNVYTEGMGFVDRGGDHFHLVRNEGSVVARTVAVQLVPAGATRRIDVTPGPAGCPF